jgi:Zinc-finger of C2H2 type
MLNHLGLHRGLTSCRLCQKTFATKSSLNTHLRNTQCGLAAAADQSE